MSFMNLQKNREGNLMASFKMSCFDLSHRINIFYFDVRSECLPKTNNFRCLSFFYARLLVFLKLRASFKKVIQ